jgi:hypothetical protein
VSTANCAQTQIIPTTVPCNRGISHVTVRCLGLVCIFVQELVNIKAGGTYIYHYIKRQQHSFQNNQINARKVLERDKVHFLKRSF